MPSLPIPGRDRDVAQTIPLAEGLVLSLPSRPGYPEVRNLSQVVRAHYGEETGVFEAALSLSPERVEIVVTAASGPRLATITWDEDGIKEDRSLLAPGGIPVGNLLSDIFISLWPRDMVAAALPGDVDVVDEADGGRTISRAGVALIEVRPDAANPSRRTMRNLSFGYDLLIVSAQ
jgi:hypothetical protein